MVHSVGELVDHAGGKESTFSGLGSNPKLELRKPEFAIHRRFATKQFFKAVWQASLDL